MMTWSRRLLEHYAAPSFLSSIIRRKTSHHIFLYQYRCEIFPIVYLDGLSNKLRKHYHIPHMCLYCIKLLQFLYYLKFLLAKSPLDRPSLPGRSNSANSFRDICCNSSIDFPRYVNIFLAILTLIFLDCLYLILLIFY